MSDAILLALADDSFASLDLSGCANVRPKTLVKVISRVSMLQSLDISGCNFTSELVYSLPCSCPHLWVLRLSGASTAHVDLRAWQRLIPRVLPSSAESWEDEVVCRSRYVLCSCSRNSLMFCANAASGNVHIAMNVLTRQLLTRSQAPNCV